MSADVHSNFAGFDLREGLTVHLLAAAAEHPWLDSIEHTESSTGGDEHFQSLVPVGVWGT